MEKIQNATENCFNGPKDNVRNHDSLMSFGVENSVSLWDIISKTHQATVYVECTIGET